MPYGPTTTRVSRLVTSSPGAAARAELLASRTGDQWSVPMLQTITYGGDPREQQFGPSTLAQRFRWLILGPPDIIAGMSDGIKGVPADWKGRLKWFLFGPNARDDAFTVADKRAAAAEDLAQKREGVPGKYGPGLYGSPTNPYGFVDSSEAIDGMAVLWVDGFDKAKQFSGGPLINALKQTDFQPYQYMRHFSALFDRVWPASYRANTDLGYNPYTGMGLASAGWHVMPADTTPPNVTDGQGIQTGAPWTRATLRVPRYSTNPAILEPRDSPTP